MKLIRDLAPLFLLLTAVASGQGPGTGVNFNHATPTAPSGARNVTFQNDSSRPTVNMSAYVTYPTVQVACPSGSDLSTAVNACLASLPAPTGGICDARACSANFTWNNPTTFSNPNQALLLPCGTLTATATVTVSPTVRNSTIHGCAYQGGSASSGTAGGSVWNYQGNGTAFVIGDPSDGSDTPGFYMTDLTLATANGGTSAHAIDFHRVQEIDVERVYFLGNNGTGQTGITLDGTGNYSGGTFQSFRLSNFGTALLMTGNGTGAANASTFTRMHVDCPTSGGSPISGGIGINLAYGDGNTFVGGDIEGCDTMLSLGAGASNNTFNGVRNENSNSQVVAASGSQYNLWLTGGTMFTGKLTDAGTHNSFADTFHRSWNNLNGDLWRSQADTTITNHVYTGIGLGNVRGRLEEWQTDVPGSPGSYQNAWQWGPGDGTTGLQLWQLEDVLNNVTRFGVQQYTTAGGNNQSFLNAAGTGSVCFNCSTNSGTGGISFGSGGATPTTVWNSDSSGNTYQLGRQDFYSASTLAWRLNCASTSACNIDSETPTASAHHLRLYNGAGTDIDSESTGGVTINNSTGGGTGPFTVYGGGATYYNTKLFQVQNNGNGTANYLLPSLAAGSGNYCLQADTSGYVTNTGHACGTGSGSGSVTSVGLSLPAQFSVANSPVTNSGTLTATWISQAGHSFLAGLDSSSTGTPTFRAIAADDVPTLNQSTSGNAATATASDHSPTQCSSGLYSQGDTTGWTANCATVQYSQLGGTVPTWNQSTTGNAATATTATSVPYSGLTGTVPTWNQSTTGNAATATTTTGNAATATALAAIPGQCSSGNYATGISAAGTANCAAVQYSQLGGTVPTWNQSTTGNAATATTATSVPYSGLTGTVPTWNQSTTGNAATATTTTGNAATATALAAIPGQCSSGNYATGISAAGTANCAAVQYSQLGGTVPTWNQSTTGNAATATTATSVPYSGLTGTVPTWNQSTTGNAATATTTTGNAATATALAAIPGQCSSGNYATGISAAGTANCAAVQYSQLGGAAPTLPNGTTATTQPGGDNSGNLATTASLQYLTTAPAWLRYLGTGADGSYEYSSTGSCSTSPTHCGINCTSGSPCSMSSSGEMYTTAFTIDSGAYVSSNPGSGYGDPVIHSTGACIIAGTMLFNGNKSTWPSSNRGVGGGSAGGSGGGAAAGTAGTVSNPSIISTSTLGQINGGAAGGTSGGNGANGASFSTSFQRGLTNSGAGGLDGIWLTGATGVQGGSTGGAGGYPGGSSVMICASINGSGGVIDLSGAYGAPPSANSTGAGSGGGGGVGILSSQTSVSTWPTIYVAGGPGGLVTVPQALATSGSCTTQPKVTLGVTSGALSSCTVAQAGAGCGTGTNITFNIVGGGGSGGTITPTWSGGALASCTASGGTGYTAATYTTAGTGGDGGNGWYAEFQGW